MAQGIADGAAGCGRSPSRPPYQAAAGESGEKAEHFGDGVRRHAAAGAGHPERDMGARFQSLSQHHAPEFFLLDVARRRRWSPWIRSPGFRHRLGGVGQEVEHHLAIWHRPAPAASQRGGIPPGRSADGHPAAGPTRSGTRSTGLMTNRLRRAACSWRYCSRPAGRPSRCRPNCRGPRLLRAPGRSDHLGGPAPLASSCEVVSDSAGQHAEASSFCDR